MSRRILMIAFTHYRSDPRVRRFAEALAARGDLVHCLCLREAGQPETVRGVRLFGLTRRRCGGLVRGLADHLLFTLVALFRAAVLQGRHRYHVVHVHTMPDFLVVAALIPRLRGARIVLDVHDTVPELFATRTGLGLGHPLVGFWRRVEVLSCRLAHTVLAVHEPHRRRLIQHGVPAGKIRVLMNLPDERLFAGIATRPVPTPCPQIIYHGTLSRHLGLDLLLAAAEYLIDEHLRFRLRILGGGPLAAELAEAVRVRGLDQAIEVVGRFRPLEEIVGEIARATIGVVPCRSTPATELMLPTKLLEYVRLGIPCVASPTEAIRHYFDDSMLCFCRPGDPRDLARALRELIQDEERRAGQAREAARFNRAHAWGRDRLDYQALIDGRSPPEAPAAPEARRPQDRGTDARGIAPALQPAGPLVSREDAAGGAAACGDGALSGVNRSPAE